MMLQEIKKKVLVVDDERQTLIGVTNILQRAGYEVISTTSGTEAIELAKNNKPEVIVLDIVLPDIDGGEVAFRLSKDPQTADIPIIFLTGILKKGEESIVKKSGKRYVLAKPASAQELVKMIQEILNS